MLTSYLCTACGHPVDAHTKDLRCLFGAGTLTLTCFYCSGAVSLHREEGPPGLSAISVPRQHLYCDQVYFAWPGLSKPAAARGYT